jgi:hypothetical protein
LSSVRLCRGSTGLSASCATVTLRITRDRETTGINGTFRDLPAVSFGADFLPIDPAHDLEGSSLRQQMDHTATPHPAQPEFESRIDSLEVRFTGGRTVILELGSMAKPLRAMR